MGQSPISGKAREDWQAKKGPSRGDSTHVDTPAPRVYLSFPHGDAPAEAASPSKSALAKSEDEREIQRQKTRVASLVVAVATAYMAYLGASSSWQYYMTADECLANVAEVAGRRVRVSGKIAPQTLRIAADRLGATFSLAGSRASCRSSAPAPCPTTSPRPPTLSSKGGSTRPGCFAATRCSPAAPASTSRPPDEEDSPRPRRR